MTAGILALAGVRAIFFPPEPPTHYHANWALFVNGERLDHSADRFMEDVAACVAADGTVDPTARVHLHDDNPDVVHVHHEGATWGHLMRNLGFGVGEDYLILDEDRRFFEEEGRSLKFVANGLAVPAADNRVIRSGDRVLISYGLETPEEVVRTQFPAVASDAEEYNRREDPARVRWGRRSHPLGPHSACLHGLTIQQPLTFESPPGFSLFPTRARGDGSMRLTATGETALTLSGEGEGLELTSDGPPISPYHFLAASLATCVYMVIEGWAERGGHDVSTLRIETDWEHDEGGSVARLGLTIRWPRVPAERDDTLRRLAEACPIHSTLRRGVDISITTGQSDAREGEPKA